MQRDSRFRREIGFLIRDMRDRNLDTNYIRRTRARLGDFAAFCEDRGILCPSKVDGETLRDYSLTLEGKKALSQRFDWAIVRRFLIYRGNETIRRFKYKPTGRSRTVRWLNAEQKQMVLDTELTPRQRLMVVAGLYGGLRMGGVRQITREDAENALITGNLTVIEKGAKERNIPLHGEFACALRDVLRSGDFAMKDKLIPVSSRTYLKEVHEIAEKSGVPVRSHDFRRTFASDLTENRIELEAVSVLLGHANLDTTRIYLQPMQQRLRVAVDSLPFIVPKPHSEAPLEAVHQSLRGML